MAGKPKKNINTPAQPVQKTGTGIPAWAPVAVIIFTALLYARSLSNGFTYIDDDYYVINNYYLRDFSIKGIKAIFTHFYSFNYHPLTSLSNLVEFHFFGLDPRAYHLFNVLLHLLNVWLVYKVAEQLSGKALTALVVAILFAVHPMHVESVAWIAERKDVLYTAFYLSSLWLYLRYTASGYQPQHYIAALLLFACSLLSKSAAVTLPVLLIAVDIYKGRAITPKMILEKIPFLLLSVLFGILAIMSQRSGGAITDMSLSYSITERIFLLLSGTAAYFIKLLLPFGLSAIHYFPDLHGGSLPWYYYLSLPFLGVLAWLVARPSAYRRELIFGTAFFLITISVMLQVVTVGAAIYSERYTYVSYLGLFYIIGQYIADKWQTAAANTVITTFTIIAALFSILTWSRISYWQNSDTLFTDIVEKNSGNYRNAFVYYYWGVSKIDEGNTKDAIEYYSKAIALKKDYEAPYINRAKAYISIGENKAAINDFSRSVTINPGNARSFNGRGWAYYLAGDKVAATSDYTKAIAIDHKYAEPYNNRGWAAYEAGDTATALRNYDTAIVVDPLFTKAYFNRAVIMVQDKNFDAAIADYNKLIRINPNDNVAYFNRGYSYLSIKDPRACADLKKAAELGNANAPALMDQYCR